VNFKMRLGDTSGEVFIYLTTLFHIHRLGMGSDRMIMNAELRRIECVG